jgi:hypothetical protein
MSPAGVTALRPEVDHPVGLGLMTSRLCSITTTELPASTSRCSTRVKLDVGHVQADRRLVERRSSVCADLAGTSGPCGGVIAVRAHLKAP